MLCYQIYGAYSNSFSNYSSIFWFLEEPAVRGRLVECLETILNKCQEPPKSKKVQHSNAKNAVLFEAINLIIHIDRYCRFSIFLFCCMIVLDQFGENALNTFNLLYCLGEAKQVY